MEFLSYHNLEDIFSYFSELDKVKLARVSKLFRKIIYKNAEENIKKYDIQFLTQNLRFVELSMYSFNMHVDRLINLFKESFTNRSQHLFRLLLSKITKIKSGSNIKIKNKLEFIKKCSEGDLFYFTGRNMKLSTDDLIFGIYISVFCRHYKMTKHFTEELDKIIQSSLDILLYRATNKPKELNELEINFEIIKNNLLVIACQKGDQDHFIKFLIHDFEIKNLHEGMIEACISGNLQNVQLICNLERDRIKYFRTPTRSVGNWLETKDLLKVLDIAKREFQPEIINYLQTLIKDDTFFNPPIQTFDSFTHHNYHPSEGCGQESNKVVDDQELNNYIMSDLTSETEEGDNIHYDSYDIRF